MESSFSSSTNDQAEVQDGCAAPSSADAFDFPITIDIKSLLAELQLSSSENILSKLIPIKIVLEDLQEQQTQIHNAEQLSTLCQCFPIHIFHIITSTSPHSDNEVILFECIWILCICTEYLCQYTVSEAKTPTNPTIKDCLFKLLLPFLLETLEAFSSSSSSPFVVPDSAKHQIYQCIGNVASSSPEIAEYLFNNSRAFDLICARCHEFAAHKIEDQLIPRLENTLKAIASLTCHASPLTPESIRLDRLLPFFAHAVFEPLLVLYVIPCLANIMPTILSSPNCVFYLPLLHGIFQHLSAFCNEEASKHYDALNFTPGPEPSAHAAQCHSRNLESALSVLFQLTRPIGIKEQSLRKPSTLSIEDFYSSPNSGMISDRFFSEICQSVYYKHMYLFAELASPRAQHSETVKSMAASIHRIIHSQRFSHTIIGGEQQQPIEPDPESVFALIRSVDFDVATYALRQSLAPGFRHIYPLSGFLGPLEGQIDALCYAKLELVDLIRMCGAPNFNGHFTLFKPLIASLMTTLNRGLLFAPSSEQLDAAHRNRLYAVTNRLLSAEFMDSVLVSAEERLEYKLLAMNAQFILKSTEPTFNLSTASAEFIDLFLELFGHIQHVCTSGHVKLVDTALRLAILSPSIFQRVLDTGNIGFAIRALTSPCIACKHPPHWPKLIHDILTRFPELIPLLFEKELHVALFGILTPRSGKDRKIETVENMRYVLESIVILLRFAETVDEETMGHCKARLRSFGPHLKKLGRFPSHKAILPLAQKCNGIVAHLLAQENEHDLRYLAITDKDPQYSATSRS